MIYTKSRGVTALLANVTAAVALGLFVSYVGLNAASGCGQGGACISLDDFTAQPKLQLAQYPN